MSHSLIENQDEARPISFKFQVNPFKPATGCSAFGIVSGEQPAFHEGKWI